jgi:hypothetical protein
VSPHIEIYVENSVNSGELLPITGTILSEAYKKERATTIPKGSTLKRVEAQRTLSGL